MNEGIKIKEVTHEEKGKQSSSRAKPTTKKELLAKVEETEKRASENHDKYLRSCAELENYKKRAVRDREDFIKYGNETLIKDMLPTVDSMERALKHASDSEDFKAFVDGLGLIRDSFLAALGRHGVEEIGAIGKDFDPNFHEALMQVEGEKKEDNKVVEEFEKGYLLNGRLLRPSKVSISKHVDK
ncbi:MAG: nucleotide exchange factor GrpE [Deltaproteobacteria bacterium]|nr:nucleotide exchange factor GrpE [Deltaproteobacteria bacterium]